MGKSVFTCYEEQPIALLWYDKALLSEVITDFSVEAVTCF